MLENVKYWLQDDSTKNFGDYLSDYFLQRLFVHVLPTEQAVRIVGSCIDDMFIPPGQRVLFWGCGLRNPGGLSEASRPDAEVLSVRGPLSRSDLRLGTNMPIGDPGLLLPFLHVPDPSRRGKGPSVLVPHYHDKRSDAELLVITGCATILRPNIVGSPAVVDDFLDVLAAAEFVLGASMHAVIAAIAYDVPFGFWDSGNIDLPFKWEDLSASIGIDCRFHATLASARDSYARETVASMRIPPLWPMLTAAPFPIRPDVFIRAVSADVARHGPDILAATNAAAADRLHKLMEDLVHHWQNAVEAEQEGAVLLQEQAVAFEAGQTLSRAALNEAEAAGAVLLQEQAVAFEAGQTLSRAALNEAEAARDAEHQDRLLLQSALDQAQAGCADALDRLARAGTEVVHARTAEQKWHELAGFEQEIADGLLQKLRDELHHASGVNEISRMQLDRQAAELDRLQGERQNLVSAGIPELQAAFTNLQAQYSALVSSSSWRALAPIRRMVGRSPRLERFASRLLRLVWWTATGQTMTRLRQRKRMAADIAFLRRQRLFDAGWYSARYADLLPAGVDPLLHYAWIGSSAGLDPHPLFDSRWYRSRLPSLPDDTVPLLHYIRTGSAAGIDPHPLFDSAYYLSQAGEAPPPGMTPLEHYLAEPLGSTCKPNRLFDKAGYRFENLGDETVDALVHYVVKGEAQGLDPHPAFDNRWYASQHPDRGPYGPLGYHLRCGAGDPTRRWPDVVGNLQGVSLGFPGTDDPRVSIVVPAYGAYAQTWRCLLAVMTNTPQTVSYEVILADDRPTAPIAPLFAGVPEIHVHVNAENLGFLRNCNRAAAHARGQYVVFLNNDTLVGRGWLRPLVALMDDPTVGMVGCKLLNADGSLQEAGGSILSNGWGWSYGAGDIPTRGAYNYVRQVDVVTGACFLISRAAFASLGRFDDRYAPAFYEEFDLAMALRKRGLHVLYQPASQVVHLGSASYGEEIRDRQSLKNHALFVKKWHALLPGQPSPLAPAFVTREQSAARGVILVIDDKVPEYDKHAGAVTLFQYLNLMQELGLKVIYHPFDGQALEPYTSVLQQRGIEVLHAPDTLADWLDRDGIHVDFIWIARPYVAGPTLDLLRRTTGARILYYTHDLHYLRDMRRFQLDGDIGAKEESERVRPIELGIFATVDRVMTPSDEEARIIRDEVPLAHVTVVPPYLFPAAGLPDPTAFDFKGRDALIFVGGFDHTPNVDAALWLAHEIMPLVWRERPDLRLLIVGNVPTPEVLALASSRIKVTGFVPALEPYYALSRVAVSPLRYGAGVKGKIVGSLRAGVPVVTTSVGNEGIRLRHGVEALIADDATGIARAILKLCADEALCHALAVDGMAVLDRQFSEERARTALLDLLGDDTCPVCGIRPRFSGPRNANWREAIACSACHAPNRTTSLVEVLLRPYRRRRIVSLQQARPIFAALRVHEFGFVGPVQAILREAPSFSMSDFFPDVAPGEMAPNNIRCEDLQALSFDDESLDLVISQDVLEHIPDMKAAWIEIFRVLRPGGRHVFSVPYASERPMTIQRAEIVDGAIHHILPPEYHGDPIREEGALAFWDYGLDLPVLLRAIGFEVTIHEIMRSGRAMLVFETVRPLALQA